MLRRVLGRKVLSKLRSSTQEELIEKFKLNADSHTHLLDYVSKHLPAVNLGRMCPAASPDCFIAPNSTLVGNVELWDFSSVWYNCVIRGDVNSVRIGVRTNIQDGTVITEARKPLDNVHDGSTVVGHHVTVGHSCRLHACTIENQCYIGMGSILHEGSYVEKNSMLGARTVLLPGTRVPAGQLWVGNPGRFVRDLTDSEIEEIEDSSIRYHRLALRHLDEFFLESPMDLYLQAERLGIPIGWSDDTIAAKEFVEVQPHYDPNVDPHNQGHFGTKYGAKGDL